MDEFPDEVINRIVFWLTERSLNLDSKATSERFLEDPTPVNSFSANCLKIRNYGDVLSLSSTCRRLRQLCGPGLFSFLSLVRTSEIDSILNYPKKMDSFSDPEALRRAYIKELIETNSNKCGYAQAARESFSSKRLDRSVYGHTLSMNHFVTNLEVSNNIFKSGELSLFPSLQHLIILDQAVKLRDNDFPYIDKAAYSIHSLKSLAGHISTIVCSVRLLAWAATVERLDIVWDVSDWPAMVDTLHPSVYGYLKELNILVNDSSILQVKEFLLFLEAAIGKSLECLSIRLTRKHSTRELAWANRSSFCGDTFLDIISKSTTLQSLTLDYDIMKNLTFSPDYRQASRCQKPEAMISFTLVDYTLSIPRLLFNFREMVANVIYAIGATHISFVYGEVVENAHLHAIALVNNLVSFVASSNVSHGGIDSVSLYKAWSVAEDSVGRAHLESRIDHWRACERDELQRKRCKKELISFSRARRQSYNSPRFHVWEHYGVVSQPNLPSQENPSPVLRHITSKDTPKDTFSSAESSLRDLEHYCLKDRAYSRIWD